MIRFKVYGVDHENLKELIANWMVRSKTPYKVETIMDVDEFIKEGISSIPTIVIQAEIKLEQRLYKDEDSFSNAIKKITAQMSSIVSKKVLVPTDFSPTAENAARYGSELAAFLGGGLELVHVLNPATDLNTGYMIDPGIEGVKRAKLRDLAERITREGKVSAAHKFILGFPIEELTLLSKEEDLLMVVGATGESDILERVFGSVASHLARRSVSPVLIVPKDTMFRPYKEIVYASSDAGMDYRISSLVKEFLSHFSCRLHCVHIGSGDQYPEWQMQAIFGDQENFPEFTTAYVEESNIVDGLNKYCDEVNADLLILTTKQRGFWRTIVHSSITKEMALNPRRPLLVLHDEQK